MKTRFFFLLYLLSGFSQLICAQNYSAEETSEIDSLNSIIANSKSADTSKALAFVAMSEILYVSNLDTMIPLCNRALEVVDLAMKKKPSGIVKTTLLDARASALNNIAYTYNEIGQSDTALQLYSECLMTFLEIGDKDGEAYVLNNMAGIYSDQGQTVMALDYYFRSLKAREGTDDVVGKAMTLNNIGLIYREQGDYDLALKYYDQSLDLKRQVDDKKGIANTLHNIASVYNLRGDTATSLNYNRQSLAIRLDLGDKKGIALSMTNIGDIFQNSGQLDSALNYYLTALELRKELNSKEGQALSNYNIGQIHFASGNISKAKSSVLDGYRFAVELGHPDLILRTASLLKKISLAEGNYKQAYFYFEEEITMRDSLYNKENYKKSQKEQARYEFDLKHTADSISHAKEQEINQIELSKQEAELQAKKLQQYGLIIGLVLLILFAGFLYNRFRITNQQKKIIETQKLEVEIQKEIIETKHKEITDSIVYAKRIQAAILPPLTLISELMPQSFVFYQPKDIVAGDFYWIEEHGDELFFAAADCTGHGVPGAMVSVMCHNGLNRSLREQRISNPGLLLDHTRKIIIDEFEKSAEEVKDGMDISLGVLNRERNKIRWAGANNPLWIIRKDSSEIIEIKGDKQPIGKFENHTPFKCHEISLNQGDQLYVFTDGFQDQFGGDKGKKFKASNLKSFLVSIAHLSMSQQKERLSAGFDQWKGELEQVDDICMIGVRI